MATSLAFILAICLMACAVSAQQEGEEMMVTPFSDILGQVLQRVDSINQPGAQQQVPCHRLPLAVLMVRCRRSSRTGHREDSKFKLISTVTMTPRPAKKRATYHSLDREEALRISLVAWFVESLPRASILSCALCSFSE